MNARVLCGSVMGSSLIRSALGEGFKNKSFEIISLKSFFFSGINQVLCSHWLCQSTMYLVFSIIYSVSNGPTGPHRTKVEIKYLKAFQ